jgi:hypothetical protein
VKRALLALCLALAACGTPLVEDTFLGTPLFRAEGSVTNAGQRPAPAEDPLRLSLFWIGFDSRGEPTQPVEQRTALDSGLGRFDMRVFGTPPERALRFSGIAGGAPLGLALIVLYADENANQALNSYTPLAEGGPDLVVGASATHLVAYAAAPIPAGSPAAELLGPIAAGYHLFRFEGPLACRFAGATSCIGNGVLIPEPSLDAIVLTLYDTPGDVVVPSPAVPGASSSGTGSSGGSCTGGNVYSPTLEPCG